MRFQDKAVTIENLLNKKNWNSDILFKYKHEQGICVLPFTPDYY